MTEVLFSQYTFRTKQQQGKSDIYDIVRKKFVALTPEEWVRQHILHYLIFDKGFSKNLLAVERGITLNGLSKRCDVLVFSNSGVPKMIIECKAPDEKLNQKVFEQIARYNLSLRVEYLWLSNGTQNYCCQLGEKTTLLNTIPSLSDINR